MSNIMKDIGAIGKSKTADMGSAGKYNFRGIDDMYNALHGLFAKYEVFIIPKVLETKLEIQNKGPDKYGSPKYQYSTITTVEYTFFTTDGSSITATGVGHALDSSDKGTNKAQSSALKYCLMQTFLIPTLENKDVENENNEVFNKKETLKSLPKPVESKKPAESKLDKNIVKISVKPKLKESNKNLIIELLDSDFEKGVKTFEYFVKQEEKNEIDFPFELKKQITDKILECSENFTKPIEEIKTV